MEIDKIRLSKAGRVLECASYKTNIGIKLKLVSVAYVSPDRL